MDVKLATGHSGLLIVNQFSKIFITVLDQEMIKRKLDC